MFKDKSLLFVSLVFLIGLHFFSFRSVEVGNWVRVCKASVLILILYLIFNFSKVRHNIKKYPSWFFVLIITLYPLLNAMACAHGHAQSVGETLSAVLPHMVVCVYFFLVKNKVSPIGLIQMIMMFAVIRTTINLIEQFTYPYVPFAFRLDGYDSNGMFREIELRGGFYRYLISDAYYLPLLSSFFSYCQLFITKSSKRGFYFFILVFSLFGLYMDQSRQILFSMFISILLVTFFQSKHKMKYIFLSLAVVLLLLANIEVIFGELVERTKDEATEENIRMLSYAYFLSDTGDLVNTMFGNGFESQTSKYGIEIANLTEQGLYRSDIGVIGAIHMMGVVFVAIFSLYYIMVVYKKWRYIDDYLKMMLVSILVNLPLIFPLYNFTLSGIECFMGILYYFVDVSILTNTSTKWHSMKRNIEMMMRMSSNISFRQKE